jgi:hypothetical protein
VLAQHPIEVGRLHVLGPDILDAELRLRLEKRDMDWLARNCEAATAIFSLIAMTYPGGVIAWDRQANVWANKAAR